MTITPETFHWQPAAWLRVEGEDAFTFLQGQFSNDLRGADAFPAVYGLWLNQKGKIVADSFVLKGTAGTWWIGSYFSPAAVIKERLESYVIADDVSITDETERWLGLTVMKSPMPEAVNKPDEEFIFPGRRGENGAWEWMSRTPKEILGARSIDAISMTERRIGAGVPAIPEDLGLGELPNEGDLDVGGISYTKGCYLGQEVMARLKNLGQVRRKLRGVKGEGAPPAPSTWLYQKGKKIGEIRSTVRDGTGFRGIALVMTMLSDPATRLSLAPDGPELIEWMQFS